MLKKKGDDINFVSCAYGRIANMVDVSSPSEQTLSDRDKNTFIDWTEEGFLEKNLEKREVPKKMEKVLEWIFTFWITKQGNRMVPSSLILDGNTSGNQANGV